MLIGAVILFGLIFLYKTFTALLLRHNMAANQGAGIAVSVMKVGYSLWQPKLTASGSLRAIRGVNVTTELAGMVQKIYFTPGSSVKEGALLVQLNADTEIGQLQALQAQAALAKITYERDKAQYEIEAVSKQTLDTDFENLKNLQGQVAQQAATVAKKSIHAPFSGRLGVSNVNPGQFLNAGDTVVSLQALDPIWVDFFIPQQRLAQIQVGQTATILSDIYPGQTFVGKITTINPAVDTNTRNDEVEVTVANPYYKLTPGTFATVEIQTGQAKRYLTLPQTAITFNSYGNVVYVIHSREGILIAQQAFVVTGETRGDQIMILQGIKPGDMVVTSGQLKLKNDSPVKINNSIVPTDTPTPVVQNEY